MINHYRSHSFYIVLKCFKLFPQHVQGTNPSSLCQATHATCSPKGRPRHQLLRHWRSQTCQVREGIAERACLSESDLARAFLWFVVIGLSKSIEKPIKCRANLVSTLRPTAGRMVRGITPRTSVRLVKNKNLPSLYCIISGSKQQFPIFS